MKIILFLFVGLGSVCTASQPNFLLFMADDMTYTDLGCYGNTDVKTPNLDGFAREGMKFNYSFNSAPMCAPTRMSLYTGIHPVRNGAHPNHSKVYPHVKSLPRYLKELGYEVAILGKRHEKPVQNFPFRFLGGRHHDNGKGQDLEIDAGSRFISKHTSKPWCLVVTSNQPHTPWNRGDSSVYKADRLTIPPYLVDNKNTREGLCKYYAEITYMDDQFGQVLKALRDLGEESNTLVVFLSEQGSNFPHCKWTCYDTGLRSAQLVRWPGVVKPGSEADALVQYVDIAPTFIEAAGGDPKTIDFDGISLLGLLKGKTDKHSDYAFGIQTSRGIYSGPEAYGIRTVRNHRYRLIWNLNYESEFRNTVIARMPIYKSWAKGDDHAKEQHRRYRIRPEYELYDLLKDPYEMKNLASNPESKATMNMLQKKLKAWMEKQGDAGRATEAAAGERK